MHDIGPKNNIVPLRPHSNKLLHPIHVEGDMQGTLDQDGNRGGISVSPWMGPLFAIRVDAPFHLNGGLMPQSQLGRNELTDEPAEFRT